MGIQVLRHKYSTFFVFHSLQLLKFNRKFNKLLGTILSINLNDKLPNKNVLELLILLLIALILLPKSQNKSKIIFFGQKTCVLGFDACRVLFLPDTLLSILLSIIFSKLFLQ